MTIEFDDLIPKQDNSIGFDDLIPKKKPEAAGFFGRMADAMPMPMRLPMTAIQAILAPKPASVLENLPPDPGQFDFSAASQVARQLDDRAAREKEFGTIGPIRGPQATPATVAKGLGTDLVAGGKNARAGINIMAGDIAQAIGDAAAAKHLNEQGMRERAQAGLMSAANTPEFQSDEARGIYSGVSSLVRQAPSLGAAILTRNPNIALGGMVAPMLPEEYGKFRERGGKPLESLAGAAINTTTEYLTEKLPMGFFVSKLGKAGAGEFLAGLLAREIPGEQIATLVQDAIDTAVANPDKTWAEYWKERPSAAYQTALATVTQASLMGAGNAAINRLSRPKQDDYQGSTDQTALQALDHFLAGRKLANAIDADSQAMADSPVPTAVQQTVARIMGQPLPPAEVPPAPSAPAPAPIPALGFDPSVRNPQPTMQVDAQGNASPMPFDQVDAIQAEVERMNNLGLTPDVQRAAAQRASSPESGPASVPSDLIQRLLGSGWTPPAAAPVTPVTPANVSATPANSPAPASDPNERYGIDHTPFSAGGKPFKTRQAAGKAKKLQPAMRVVSVPGGFALADKTEKQLAAEAKAAKRIAGMRSGTAGMPMSAHEFIASHGGLSRAAAADLGIEGNVKIGNRWLYAGQGKGLTIEQATQKLVEAGYIQSDSHNDALDIIRRSVASPQYTPAGWEQVAQAQHQAEYEDHLAAQHDAAQNEDFDPFTSLAEDGYLEDDSDDTGFWQADPAVHAQVRALIAQAEALGIDADGIMERVALQSTNVSQKDFHEAARTELDRAIQEATGNGRERSSDRDDGEGRQQGATEPRGNGNRGEVDGQQEHASAPREAGSADADQELTASQVAITAARIRRREDPRTVDPRVDSIAAQEAYLQGLARDNPEQGQAIASELRANPQKFSDESNAPPDIIGRYAGIIEAQLALRADAAPANGKQAAPQENALTTYDQADIEQRLDKLEQAEQERKRLSREAEQKAQADAQRDDFTLTGSDRPADVAAARGQQDIFSAPAPDANAPMPKPGMTPHEAVAHAFKQEGSTDADAAMMAKRIQQQADKNNKAMILWWNPEDGELVAFSETAGDPFDGNGVALTTMEPTADPREKTASKQPEPKSTPDTVAKNEDVGQQLYANRRNFTGRGLKWEDVQGLNETLKVKEVTKAKVWPRPNYEQLVADGMSPLLARMVKQVYDGISAGPSLPSKTAADEHLERYIDTLTKIREGIFGFVNDKNAVGEFASAVTALSANRGMSGPVAITDMLKTDVDAKAISQVLLRRIWPDQYEGNMRPFVRGTQANQEVSIIGGNKALGALQFVRQDFAKWGADLTKGWPGKREAWEVQGYRVLAPGEYTGISKEQPDGTSTLSITPKQGRGAWRIKLEDGQFGNDQFVLVQDGGFGGQAFPTREAAIEAAREKVKRKAGVGQDTRGTNIEDATRVGPERREEGDAVTSQRLMDTFGFRGVNFGREGWINQAERQAYLNQAFDGLMDLADVLGVPPKAMSLNGALGIAFGAQGKGRAAAHFVPGVNEINLTKTKGAGTLAHEWGHALDHHFANQAGLAKDAEPMLSEHAYKGDTTNRVVWEDGKYTNKKGVPTFDSAIRPEIVQAFRTIYQAMEKRNETETEAQTKTEAAKASALKNLASWLKAARSVIESSKAENKTELLAELDQHAEKMRQGDTGDGYETSGKSVFSARVAAVRNLIKEATGRVWSNDETQGLERTASHMRYLLGQDDAQRQHEPQKVSTQYKRHSAAMDKEKGGRPYWSTPTEMFARAFELYVHDKLAQKEQTNTFLSDAAERAQRPVKIADTSSAFARSANLTRELYLYPTEQERKDLASAFDGLVQAIDTRDTDNGIDLFRHTEQEQGQGDGPRLYAATGTTGSKGQMSLDAIEKAVQSALKGVPDAPRIEVFADPAAAGIAVPPGVSPMGGTLPDGRVLVFANNIGAVIDVHQTVFHELLHRGAKVRFTRNADYITSMLDLSAQDAKVRILANNWKTSADGQDKRAQFLEHGPLTGQRLANFEALAVEEALAEIAETLALGANKPPRTTIERIVQALAKVAKAFGMTRLANWLNTANASAAERFVMDTVRMSGGITHQGTTAVLFAKASVASAAAPWTVAEPGAGDAFVRAIQNNKIDVKRVRDAIASKYGKPTDGKDAYLAEELYHGKVAARVNALYDEQVEPILQKIAVAGKNVGLTLDDVNLYLHARHAPERNAAMKAINPGMQDNEALSGMSDQEAAKVLADFATAGKVNALTKIAADVDQLLHDTRTALVADGLEDAGVINAWEHAYKHYVPLQRDIKGSGTPKGMGFSVRGPESKRAVGSKREVVNILANIVTQAETGAIRAEKAEVGRTLLAMAKTYPNPDFWKVDIPPTKPRIDKDTGLVIRTAIDPMYQTADNVVMVKDYGQEHFIVFNKDNERAMAMAHAMKNLDIAPMNKILEVANKGTRFLASLLTQRNPLFWLTNFARDIQGALVNLEGTDAEGLQREAIANLPQAFKGMHELVRGKGAGQWARYAKELQDAGGTTGYMQVFENSDKRMADLENEVAKMSQGKADPRRLARLALEFVDDYNDIIENAVRLSVFQAAREGNVSTAKAASIAKNITVNFNRKGNLTPPINALYMFFNASVQGTARLTQAIVTSKTARAAVGGIAVMGFVLDALNRMAAGDDDETKRNRYDLIPEFEKARNWIFMNPMRPGEYVKVPLPLGPHVFHNAGRLLSDAIFRKNPRNASEYGWSIAGVFLDAFSPLGSSPSLGQLIAPSVLDPAVQIAENKSFTGAPVYKSADRGFGRTDPKPAYTRHFESTPDVWKGASRLLNDITGGDKDKPGIINVEPDILKHVFYTMTGGPGRTLDQAIDLTQAGARGKDVSVNRVPLASRFYGANDDAQRERVYYDDRKRALDAKTAFDHFTKVGRQDLAKEVASELGDGDVVKGRRKMLEFSAAEKSVRKINGSIRRELERDDDGEAKSVQLKALRQRRMRVMSNAVDDD